MSAATETTLCNYALAKMGGGLEESFKIDSISGDSDTEVLCELLYDQVRKEVLCRAWWSEAAKYAELGDELDDIDKADWEYAFNLPDDYLGRCKQINESYHRSTKSKYQVEYDKEIAGGMLFTNHYSNSDEDTAYIKYIYDLEDPSEFGPLLYEAVAIKLAAELCPAMLSDKGETKRRLLEEYEGLVLPLAEGMNAEQQGDDEDKGEFTALTCRTP